MSAGKAAALPEREKLVQAVETAQKAQKARSSAQELKSTARTLASPKERDRLYREAYAREVEAHGYESKLAKRMQSGTWQGGGIGAGIGAGVGMGLGTVVGTLVGGVTALPTTGLGLLIGAGTGAVHGPFVKLNGGKKRFEDAKPEEVVDALEQEQDLQKKVELEQRVEAAAEGISTTESDATARPRRKPRKLEVRSSGQIERTPSTEQVERRKPRKIEIRSVKQQTGEPQNFYAQSNGQQHALE